MNPTESRDIALKFSLPDQDGEQVNLTDFQGQRVLELILYPKASDQLQYSVQACGLTRQTWTSARRVSWKRWESARQTRKLPRFPGKELLNPPTLPDLRPPGPASSSSVQRKDLGG